MSISQTRRPSTHLCLVLLVASCLAIPTVASSHPLIEKVDRYRQAVKAGDVATIELLQAADARIWFAAKEGPGRPLNPAGKGPWKDWDRFFQARSHQLDAVVVGDSVRILTIEINDFYRLTERVPVPYYIHYFFDGDGRIAGKLIERIEGMDSPADRLEEFAAWARRRHPGLMEELMPHDQIDPALEKARKWRTRLIEWREESGLLEILPSLSR